ncbi:hypothetical protein [Candidatus Albibeggiatoa sp. nov. NOAA]|uniref:ribonuclease T2 family protein n=1 Tax=Candidatus Albibeggiatoa sp. nov. NOAA TaxID=3162724 RepID=UPI0032F26338|nr:hypothetical protein [Thiotrichaceae bacterium]
MTLRFILLVTSIFLSTYSSVFAQAECDIEGTGAIIGAPVGCYDYFTYAQLWAAQTPYTSKSSGILTPDPTEQQQRKQGYKVLPQQFAATHLIPHGLWPNFLHNVVTYPAVCNSSESFVFEDLSAPLRNELNKLYPQVIYGLDKHEWKKHGTCTGWTAEKYFSLIVELNQKLGTPQLIAKNIGKTVNYLDLLETYGGDAQHVYFSCDTEGEKQILTQIFTLWDKELKPLSLNNYHAITPCNSNQPIYIRSAKLP